MRRQLLSSQRRLLSVSRWKTRLVFWTGAVAIGGAAAVFAKGADYADHYFHLALKYGWWVPLILTPAGLVLVAFLTRKVLPGAEGSGIPQAIAALRSRNEPHRSMLLSMRIAVGKILLTLIGLLSGASIGREGPTVHVGAAVMYSIGRFAKFPRHDIERGLILAGGAAGIAAAFNTPIAGIVFAIEEMSQSFEEETSGTLFLAVVLAGVVAVAVLGDYTYFGRTEAAMVSYTNWIAVAVCGVVGGAFGGIFSWAIVTGNRKLRPFARRHPLYLAAACGLVVAGAGVLSGGDAFGTGYSAARELVTGTGHSTIFYPVLKMVATVASYFSGIPGGIFAPSLSVGAGLGDLLSNFMPGVPVTVVVILGMVAYFSGVVQTPITAFVIVMEMTANQTMLLPLMAASFIAYGVSTMICKQPIYRALSEAFVWVEPKKEEDEKPEGEEGEAAPAEGEANTAADDKPSDRV
jgi:H+/Cl- antiporter ClcA